MRIVQHLLGCKVVVRSRDSGVWLGELADAEGVNVRLLNARRAWTWQGAASCSELATKGPTAGKFPAPVPDVAVLGCCEVLEASATACAAWDAVPVWSGRD